MSEMSGGGDVFGDEKKKKNPPFQVEMCENTE